MNAVWGLLVILIFCPILGGLPLIAGITRLLTGKKLRELGTGNVSVSAAFYHGGKLAGVLAVISEAAKGIIAVLLARVFFPAGSEWELVALIALVMGRYVIGKGAGTTNVVWGFVVHDWLVAGLTCLIGGIGFKIWRDKQSAKYLVLILFPVILGLVHPREGAKLAAAIALAATIAAIYQKIPDDLDLPADRGDMKTQSTFRFFRGDRAIITLDRVLDAQKVGQKAANLSQLKAWGYSVPEGWILPARDDLQPIIDYLHPTPEQPLVVRSSAVGEDSASASSAGIYRSILNVTSRESLKEAIALCLQAYDTPSAMEYRQDFGVVEGSMSILIQKQIPGVFSGVAFSRDPVSQQGDTVVIEALPGNASQIVSGKVTPQTYYVNSASEVDIINAQAHKIDIPTQLIQQVAQIARELETRFQEVPQDVEWTYDGKSLWILQARPVTTLLPIWTRKIASEVIPGIIHPLTWSINRPLTCGVWGEIFSLVLGKRAEGLDFNSTATLHYSQAYFNASLLGEIFLRMGLPAKSLEFLTRGEKFTKPPLSSTITNLPGLLRLLKREISLKTDFQKDDRAYFIPTLEQLATQKLDRLTPSEIWERVIKIRQILKKATYYSIMAPLSFAIRQSIFKTPDSSLDRSLTPEVASMRSLRELAGSETGFDCWLETYGYLSQVGTDISVPTWKEDPQMVRNLLSQFVNDEAFPTNTPKVRKRGLVQSRLDLKGRVTEVYSRLLAELRWCFVALEELWIDSGHLSVKGDVFFLEVTEIEDLVAAKNLDLQGLIAQRRSQYNADAQLTNIPYLFYGNSPPHPQSPIPNPQSHHLQGIGASPGIVVGRVKVVRNFQVIADINPKTILVVPYTDSGWAPLLSRVGGIIAEVGGRLSHGAIVAREYGIPAVMDIPHATQILQDGQMVRIDGQTGSIQVFDELN
ncbi:glycerol-3-phosphate acyltransferase [Merismopedia glauca]|uniref:Pyruvate phosphate dikinase PEP/pyruvate-binding protein n=1 Tax=Merismopedia glauca CCAP 1448/3 TaxID=1296344 RepID=A0A2T1C857_9CYAN|nr:glycerol-3-phosphate acyltransferase [Merismopedia glauca]PSB04431.1 pyruvate phosphate dikinase PEP/pyruvate-binding protein [Merismopedia glauca CCAP 1448/3]